MVSTDEVYGSLAPDAPGFTEQTPLAPNSPYAASKAAADLLCRSFHRTFGLDVRITRCSNNYGPYQFPEKLIPLMLSNALEDRPLPIYGDGQQVRDWLHVQDHCRAIDLVMRRGRAGEVYNIGGGNEWANLDLVKLLLGKLGKARVADHVRRGSSGPRPPLRHRGRQDPQRAGLGAGPRLSGWSRTDRAVVSRASVVVGEDPQRRLP